MRRLIQFLTTIDVLVFVGAIFCVLWNLFKYALKIFPTDSYSMTSIELGMFQIYSIFTIAIITLNVIVDIVFTIKEDMVNKKKKVNA